MEFAINTKLISVTAFIHFLVTGINMQTTDMCVEQINNCACKTKSGYINLEPLDTAKNGGQARFQNIPDRRSSYVYTYNPCSMFTMRGCKDVAVCVSTQMQYMDVGIQSSAKFISDSHGVQPVIEYTSQDNQMRTDIVLQCDPQQEGRLVSQSSSSEGVYTLRLTTKYACSDIAPPPGGGGGGGGGSGGISVGDVMLIVYVVTIAHFISLSIVHMMIVSLGENPPSVKMGYSWYSYLMYIANKYKLILTAVKIILRFFVALTVYFTAGLLFNKFHKGARGVELLPNVDFWKALPGLAKDGVKYFWSKIRRNKTGYDEI